MKAVSQKDVVQWNPQAKMCEYPQWFVDFFSQYPNIENDVLTIKSLDGEQKVFPGDYIINE